LPTPRLERKMVYLVKGYDTKHLFNVDKGMCACGVKLPKGYHSPSDIWRWYAIHCGKTLKSILKEKYQRRN
jgi:hypothetical protein